MGQLQQLPPPSPDLGVLSINIIFLLLGVYGWEYVQSFHVECALLCGRLAFRLSLIPYILGRASFLVFLVLLAIGTGPYSRGFLCLPGTLAIASLGGITLGCSSTNFLIRTWVIWKNSRLVHVLLLLLALGQWTLLVLDVAVVRSIPVHCVCDVFQNYPQMNAVTLIYTILLDFLVLVLSVVGLSSRQSESPLKKRLRSQGMVYFAVAGISYIPPMVAALLHNIPIYNLVSNLALTTSTIVSSKAVRSLHALDMRPLTSEDDDVALTSQFEMPPVATVREPTACARRRVDETDRC